MRTTIRYLTFFSSLTLAACTTFYREALPTESHAVIEFAPMPGVYAKLYAIQTVHPKRINGKMVNQFRYSMRSWRVQPGEVQLVLQANDWGRIQSGCVLEFTAVAGKTYYVTRRDDGDSFRIFIAEADAEPVDACTATKY